jgi:hypothetical protein
LISCNSENDVGQISENPGSSSPLFRSLASSRTGIDFENALEEGLNTNILMYEYFYNGGGVAAADFNGDDLVDLYFSANMSPNRLYINKGGLKFVDITGSSAVSGRPGPWKTGVSAVDVNGDDRIDIYLCYSGALPPEKRANQLFLNMGNDQNGHPVFQDIAPAIGLASTAFSTQSYFFDYDRDGDLDMLLLNHNPKNLPLLSETRTASLQAIDDPLIGVRLYNQRDGRFYDVTQSAGISSSALTYGLGIGISDLNQDGFPDFYVSNDYSVPDYLYINQRNGTFKNTLGESVGHISQFSMGNDIADINNDGYPDIITLDMLPEDNRRQKLLLSPDDYSKFDLNERSGFYRQYMRNMLHLNHGNGSFSEIGQLAGISNTDWSWSALLADYDNDGWKDLYVTNGYLRDYTNLDFINYMNDFVQSSGQLNREDVIGIVQEMPSSDISNYMFRNRGGINYDDITSQWNLKEVANSNGAAYADLDNDGDLDLIVNNINQKAFVYENLTADGNHGNYIQLRLSGSRSNSKGIGAKVIIYTGDIRTYHEVFPFRGYQSSVDPIVHAGLGEAEQIDSLVIIWPDGMAQMEKDIDANQRIIIEHGDAGMRWKSSPESTKDSPIFTEQYSPIEYTHRIRDIRDFDRQPLLLSEISRRGPAMAKGDINGDSQDDLLIGGTDGQSPKLFIQKRNGTYRESDLPRFGGSGSSEDCDLALFDMDNDGDLDLYVAKGGYENFNPGDPVLRDLIYANNGGGDYSIFEDGLPELKYNSSCVRIADVDRDGFQDIFIGGGVQPGNYPVAEPSFLLRNDGAGNFNDVTSISAPGFGSIGMVTDASWVDMNGDEWPDLVVVGEWMPIRIFINREGQLVDESASYLDNEYRGIWNALHVEDLNGDNLPDLVVGNIGTNIQFKVTDDFPATMHYKDFDNNGSIDPIFSYYIDGVLYPYITRDELKRQLASVGNKYTSYASYADESLYDVFSEELLKDAKELHINTTETVVFLSENGKEYRRVALPPEAQFAPVHTITLIDYNQDGHKDLLLCGNDERLKLRLGEIDANYGFLFQGDSSGQFTYVDQLKSGLKIRGDVRDVEVIGDLILFGLNNGKLVAYSYGAN